MHLLDSRVDVALISSETVRELFTSHIEHYKNTGEAFDTQYYMRHPDEGVRNRIATLFHEIHDSDKWAEKVGTEKVPIEIMSVNDVDSVLSYFELKKIIKMEKELIIRLSTETDPIKQVAIQTLYLNMRKMEADILKKHRQVTFALLKYNM